MTVEQLRAELERIVAETCYTSYEPDNAAWDGVAKRVVAALVESEPIRALLAVAKAAEAICNPEHEQLRAALDAVTVAVVLPEGKPE